MNLFRENGVFYVSLIIILLTTNSSVANSNENINNFISNTSNCHSMNACELLKLISKNPNFNLIESNKRGKSMIMAKISF